MNSLNETKRILSRHRDELERKFGVKKIGIFGSYANGESKKSSDLDLLVELKTPIGLFKFMDLEDYLEKLLGVKVDLVTRKALKPHIGKAILKELVPV